VTTRDLLGVAIRIIGVWFLAIGATALVISMMRGLGLAFMTVHTWRQDLDAEVSWGAVGILVFLAAGRLVYIAYDGGKRDDAWKLTRAAGITVPAAV